MQKDSLGNRMKTYYEERSRTYLTRRTPVIMRLDGVAFHTFTRGMCKPFDRIFVESMQETMKYLCENIQGCVLGYTQSDEITLILVDYKNLTTAAWFDYQVQKMVSVGAGMASMYFNKVFSQKVAEFLGSFPSLKDEISATYMKAVNKGAFFDARVFNIPVEEVVNCVLWRQLDAERNSILAIGQANLSHKELQNKSCKDIMNILETEGIVWGEYPTTLKRGSCCIKKDYYVNSQGEYVIETEETHLDSYGDMVLDKTNRCIGSIGSKDSSLRLRTHWVIDNEIPRFINEGREYIEKLI